MVNRSVTNLVLDATYLNRVNRVNGPDSPQGVYKGDGFLLNAGYQTKIGKLSAFGYLLDFEPITNIPARHEPDSRLHVDVWAALRGRQAGGQDQARLRGVLREANRLRGQSARFRSRLRASASSPRRSASSASAWARRSWKATAGAGKGFTTPLATLHKFQGWADKFLTTPPNGLEDLYANASVNLKGVGVLDTLGFIVSYHDYDAERDLGRLRQRMERVHRRETQAFQPDAQVRGLPAGRAGVGAHHQQAVGAGRVRLVNPGTFFHLQRGGEVRCPI